MNQIGTVIKTEGRVALVSVPRSSACGQHCAACPGGCQAKKHIARADNPIGAKEGDRVLLTAPGGDVLRGTAFLYGVPLLFFFIGYALIFKLTNSEAWSISASLLCMAAAFYALHLLDKQLAPKTQITEIIRTDT